MTNEQAVAEVQRQLALFPRVCLAPEVFNRLHALAESAPLPVHPRRHYDYEYAWGMVRGEERVTGFVMNCADAQLMIDSAMAYLAQLVADALTDQHPQPPANKRLP